MEKWKSMVVSRDGKWWESWWEKWEKAVKKWRFAQENAEWGSFARSFTMEIHKVFQVDFTKIYTEFTQGFTSGFAQVFH